MLIATSTLCGSVAIAAEDQSIIDVAFIQEAEYQKDENGAFVFVKTSVEHGIRLFSSDTQYIKETMIIQPLTQEDAERIEADIIALRAGGGSQEKYSNLSGAVTAYVSIYYSTDTTGGKDTIWLTKVTGKYTVNVSSANVVGHSVTYGQIGVGPSGSCNQHDTVALSTNNWTVTPPSNWSPVYDISGYTQGLGATYNIDYVVGNSQSGQHAYIELLNYVLPK